MTEERGVFTPQGHDIDAQWDECVDLTVLRFIYSSLSGGFGLLLFRSPVSPLAAVAFGAGVTLNALRNLVGSPIKFLPPTPKVSDMPAPETVPPNTVSYVTDISKGDRFLMVVFGLDRSMDN